MLMTIYRLVLFTLSIAYISDSVFCEDRVIDTILLDRLNTQAVIDWQNVERELRTVDVTYRYTYFEGKPGKMQLIGNQTFRFAFDSHRRVALLRIQKDGFPDDMSRQLANPRYSFEVSNGDATALGTLQNVSIEVPKEGSADSTWGLPDWGNHTCNILAACRLSCLPLEEMLNPVDFEPLEAIHIEAAGRKCIRFSAKYIGKQGKLRIVDSTYTVTLDTSNSHAPTSWTIEAPDALYTSAISYHDGLSPLVPQKITYAVDSGGLRSEQAWTYDLPIPCTIPEEEFYLPHYGFSEQVLETLNPNPWPRWLLIIGGVLSLFIGGWLIKRRSQAA